MIKLKFKYILLGLVLFTSCADLDLNPLSEGSSENWYSNEVELELSVNELFRSQLWMRDLDDWTDDWTNRNALTPISSGVLTGEDGLVTSRWNGAYRAIARANAIINNIDKAEGVPQELIDGFLANARFVRASQYAYLISHFGDVPFYTEELDIDAAFALGRTDKNVIKQAIYDDFDLAVPDLPISYGGGDNQKATKGAAMAMKARAALYNGDWAIARDAAKACMDLKEYNLYPDYRELFLSHIRNTSEQIFGLPNSTDLGSFTDPGWITRRYVIRNAGGFAAYQPSWDLFGAYLCIDGLPIDESPLYNAAEPYKNRDPRLTETMPEPGSDFLGFRYTPHPDSVLVFNLNTGLYQNNRDSEGANRFASFNGLVWKKSIDDSWIDRMADNDRIVMRYADVLLMYVEAKIELGEVDQSTLDAINMVRARAYKVDYTDTGLYPAVITTDVAELRTILRMERRMEFAHEGLRYMDIIRWRIAEQVLNTPVYGNRELAFLQGETAAGRPWFMLGTPDIDENGSPNYDAIFDDGLIEILAQRAFPDRQYLWPIPSSEVLINENVTQNEGY